jgi:SAM-dependent methyltransferase
MNQKLPGMLMVVAGLATLQACARSRNLDDLIANPPDETLARLYREARALEPVVQSPAARGFVGAVAELPPVDTRVVYRIKDRKEWYAPNQLDTLSRAERDALERKELDSVVYYYTKYGTPLAYARAIDILGENGLHRLQGKRILDFGYGGVGHLRMLAANGADVVGVDVDPFLPALYQKPTDQGVVRAGGFRKGHVRLVHGRFPAESKANEEVGGKYDLILSKNTLKKGYIHPPETANVDPARRVWLGVDDSTFLRVLYSVLKPGGRVLIYNICPAQAPKGQAFIPHADGRSPFSVEQWQTAGFRVIAFDKDDSTRVRNMARALEWDQGESAMSVDTDLFAMYTLVEKPAR